MSESAADQPVRTLPVGAYLAHRLREVGVEHLFGVPGDFNLTLLDTIAETGLLQWVGSLMPLAEALQVLLGVLRDSGAPQQVVAHAGQYSQSLPAGRLYRLLRVRLEQALQLVPEISGHRLMVLVRLMRQEPDGRLRASEEDSSFELTLCA